MKDIFPGKNNGIPKNVIYEYNGMEILSSGTDHALTGMTAILSPN